MKIIILCILLLLPVIAFILTVRHYDKLGKEFEELNKVNERDELK